MLLKLLYLYLILMVSTPPISSRNQLLRCFYSKRTGIGKTCTSRWYYNWNQNKCIMFTYCGTNFGAGNNFPTRLNCIRNCKWP